MKVEDRFESIKGIGVAYMKHRFTGIAISDTKMIGIDLAYKKGEFLIQDVFQLQRQGRLVDDCQRFIKHFSLEGQNIAAAVISERRDQLLVTPSLSRFETADLLKWQIADYVDWPEEYYYYDFVIEEPPKELAERGDVEKQFVYVVALPQALVRDVATGILKGRGNLEIIDFFPGALTRRFVEHNGSVIALFNKNSIELTGWYRHMCIAKRELPLALDSVKDGVEQLETDLYTYGVPGIAGIACFDLSNYDMNERERPIEKGGRSLQAETVRREISDFLHSYGSLTPIYCGFKEGERAPLNIGREAKLYEERDEKLYEEHDEKAHEERGEKFYEECDEKLYEEHDEKAYEERGEKLHEAEKETLDDDGDAQFSGQTIGYELEAAHPLLWHMALGLAIRGLYKPSF